MFQVYYIFKQVIVGCDTIRYIVKGILLKKSFWCTYVYINSDHTEISVTPPLQEDCFGIYRNPYVTLDW